jgi:tRNA dimethylallyltransferase
MSAPPALVLTGPTGSGKSELAWRLAQELPLEIISVDSAQVYRGMDIGTAKPSTAQRAQVRHHLLDIRDPAESYSAGEFVRDARAAMQEIQARGNRPLLVGGTMLYLRALLRGIAELPPASPAVRAELDARASREGWPALHAELARIDAQAAIRIHPLDAQRIQRALEVERLTGRPISAWQAATRAPAGQHEFLRFAIVPGDRAALRQRLAARFDAMLEAGLVSEVEALRRRPELHAELPALRSVGYRQLWSYCAGHESLASARERAITATGQLAKRQMTWLRSESGFEALKAADTAAVERVLDVWRSGAHACMP